MSENEELIEEVEYLSIIDGASIEGLKYQGVNDFSIDNNKIISWKVIDAILD